MEEKIPVKKVNLAKMIFVVLLISLIIILVAEYYYLKSMNSPSPSNYDGIVKITGLAALNYIALCITSYFVCSKSEFSRSFIFYAVFPAILSGLLFLIFMYYGEIFHSYEILTGYYVLGPKPVWVGLASSLLGFFMNLILGAMIIFQNYPKDTSEQAPPPSTDSQQ